MYGLGYGHAARSATPGRRHRMARGAGARGRGALARALLSSAARARASAHCSVAPRPCREAPERRRGIACCGGPRGAAGGGGRAGRRTLGGRVRAVRGAERVVDVDVGALGQLLRVAGVVLGLLLVEAHVLEHQQLRGAPRRASARAAFHLSHVRSLQGSSTASEARPPHLTPVTAAALRVVSRGRPPASTSPLCQALARIARHRQQCAKRAQVGRGLKTDC